MATNILVIVTGYGSVSPKPWKNLYLNVTEANAHERFLQQYPTARDTTVTSVTFVDELRVSPNGDLSSTLRS